MDKKILIIDDNEQDRKIIERFFTKAGFKLILTAKNGEDGIKKANKERPDLVITDTMLPDINGFEICRQLKKIQKQGIPKIIIITGSIDAVDAVKAKEVGADDYCAKTSDFSVLVEIAKKLI